MKVEVWFDYTCRFSYRAHEWLETPDVSCDVDIRWRPFSLLEQNRHGEDEPVFEQSRLRDNVSLIALAVHQAVRIAEGDVDGYRRRMFAAWHEEPGRLATEDIVDFGRQHGLVDFDRAAAFDSLAAEHAKGQQVGVFGTPSLVYGPGQAAFLKLDDVPTDGSKLWGDARRLALEEPTLREWKRVTPDDAS